MIYAGLIHFNNSITSVNELTAALQSFTDSPPAIIRKNSLVLCYGKLSNEQDLDDIWENNFSLLMGRVFDKDKSCAFKQEDFKDLAFLDKEETLKNIWGKYIYIQRNKEVAQFEIVVDSTGQLPFFYYLFSNGDVLFSSDIEIIYKVLSQKPEYNWEYLCSYLIYGNSSAIQTPFKNIFELPPACSLTINKTERKTTPFWKPLNSYKNVKIKDTRAVDVLQATLKPWIEPYQNIYVSLSGGLDSSSLMYCLKDIVRDDQTLKAINYFHSHVKSSNELIHARQVCEEIGVELIEIDASNSLPFDSCKKNKPLKPNKPFSGLISSRWNEIIRDHLPSKEAYTFISGHGSDHIFMRPPSKRSISDYILERGFQGVKRELSSIAQFYRDPLWSILRENATGLFSYFLAIKNKKRGIKNAVDEIPLWIKQRIRQKASKAFIHPIYGSFAQRIAPGKYDQIDGCYEGICSIHMEIMNQADPTYYPFLYQPVMEFALSFPTYTLFEKGYDRYPLRKSVNETFQTNTVWRRDKSQTTGIFQLGVKQNLEKVLGLCLEGHFAKERLVDTENLQKTITLIGNGDTKYMWPFTHLASAEMFLKHWDEKI